MVILSVRPEEFRTGNPHIAALVKRKYSVERVRVSKGCHYLGIFRYNERSRYVDEVLAQLLIEFNSLGMDATQPGPDDLGPNPAGFTLRHIQPDAR